MIRLSLQFYPVDIQNPDHLSFKLMRLREISSAIRTLRDQVQTVSLKIQPYLEREPHEFVDGQWLKADEKRKILKQWTSFVKNGFSDTLFTSAIYEHLHLHCGYIAHYDKRGFYTEYWGIGDIHRHAREDNFTVRPIPNAFGNWRSFIEQFTSWGDYSDINTSMMIVLKTELESLLNDLMKEAREHFEVDVSNSFQLYLIEKQNIQSRIDNLRKEAEAMERGLSNLRPEDHRKDLDEKYAELFGVTFSAESALSQLSLI